MYTFDLDESWDYVPEPLDDEMFLSWFTRLAKENCSDVDLLIQKLLSGFGNNDIDLIIENLDLKMELRNVLIEKIESYVNIPKSKMKTISLKFPDGYNVWDYLNKPCLEIKYCPFCISEDSQPYFRYYWQLKFVTLCLNHKCQLIDKCPHCFQQIQYWKSDWNEKLTSCFNCKKVISQTILVTKQGKPENLIFQKDLFEIYDKNIFQKKRIDSNWFFQQLWKIVLFDQNRINLSKLFSISLEYLFKGITKAYTAILYDEERLIKPFYCDIDNQKFKTMNSYLNHKRLNHNSSDHKIENFEEIDFKMLKTPEDVAIAKYSIIQPLLTLNNRTYNDVKKYAGSRGISTLYRWIGIYQKDGINGLLPKYHFSGRKNPYPNGIEQLIVKIAKNGILKKTALRDMWKQFRYTLNEKGYSYVEIPSYLTFSRRIKNVSFDQ